MPLFVQLLWQWMWFLRSCNEIAPSPLGLLCTVHYEDCTKLPLLWFCTERICAITVYLIKSQSNQPLSLTPLHKIAPNHFSLQKNSNSTTKKPPPQADWKNVHKIVSMEKTGHIAFKADHVDSFERHQHIGAVSHKLRHDLLTHW